MGEINIPRDQQHALAAIDTDELEKLIEQAIQMDRIGDLYHPLVNCGSYITNQLHYFEQALRRHRNAKAPRKRAETANGLRRAASDLSYAVAAMKRRMETEKNDGEIFFVDDQIIPPHRFNKHLSVCVSYRWRRTVDDQWKFGSIMFTHDVDLRPDYTIPTPKRNLSTAKQEQDLQKRLLETWEHLMRAALYSVRDFFKDGGDGGDIPNTFQVAADPYSRGLNNHSARFWRQQPF